MKQRVLKQRLLWSGLGVCLAGSLILSACGGSADNTGTSGTTSYSGGSTSSTTGSTALGTATRTTGTTGSTALGTPTATR
jgi:hypothetical protein